MKKFKIRNVFLYISRRFLARPKHRGNACSLGLLELRAVTRRLTQLDVNFQANKCYDRGQLRSDLQDLFGRLHECIAIKSSWIMSIQRN